MFLQVLKYLITDIIRFTKSLDFYLQSSVRTFPVKCKYVSIGEFKKILVFVVCENKAMETNVTSQNEANMNLANFQEIIDTYRELSCQDDVGSRFIIKTIESICEIEQKTKNAIEEKERLEREIVRKEMMKELRQDNLQKSKELIRRDRLRNKIMRRENDKMKESVESVMKTLPANHIKEILSRIKEQQLIRFSRGNSTSDSNLSITSESSYSSASLFSANICPVPLETSKISLVPPEKPSLPEHTRHINSVPSSEYYIADVEEFSFSGRISSSTESDRSSILVFPTIMDNIKTHQHQLKSRYFVMGNKCNVCHKKIGCGMKGYCCDACHAAIHDRCRDFLALPCIPMKKRTRESDINSIESFICQSFKPSVPAIVIHCVLEIEKRGLDQIGLYKVPEYDRKFQNFMQWCLQGTGMPNLGKIKINLICELLKNFLGLIKPALITREEFEHMQICFDSSVSSNATITGYAKLYNALFHIASEYRRNTLIFMILHLQKVAESQACKMSPRFLSKTFTPILVENYKKETYDENKKSCNLLERFIKIESSQWQSMFIRFL